MLSPARHPRLVMFIAGMILFEYRDSIRLRTFASKGTFAACVIFIVGLIFPLALNPKIIPGLTQAQEEVWRAVGLWIGCFCIAAASFFGRGLPAKIFSWTPLRWLGNMSYSYYLIHGVSVSATALAVKRLSPGNLSEVMFWCLVPVTFAVTLVSSLALFGFVEKPYSLAVRAPKLKAKAAHSAA